jgi:uncharacterized protein YcbX
MIVSELIVYPIKGARGIALERAWVEPMGMTLDRRFMVVREDGSFVTQRTHPSLACVRVMRVDERVVVEVDTLGAMRLSTRDEDYPGVRVKSRVWDDVVESVDAGEEAARFFTQHLGEPVRLRFMPDDVVRPVESPYGAPGDRVSFADGFPLLLCARASLDDVNAQLTLRGELPVPMNRFRPNVVVDGGAPWEEERFLKARLGSGSVRMPKRCARCQVTTVDQTTAAVGKEPLRTLASYRRDDSKVFFGQNAIPDGAFELRLGDDVVYENPK